MNSLMWSAIPMSLLFPFRICKRNEALGIIICKCNLQRAGLCISIFQQDQLYFAILTLRLHLEPLLKSLRGVVGRYCLLQERGMFKL